LGLGFSDILLRKSFGEDQWRLDDLLIDVFGLSDDRWLKNLFVHNWLNFFQNLSPFKIDEDGSLLNDFMEVLNVRSC